MKTQISRMALMGRMTAAERAAGRFMRGPDGHSPFSQVKDFQDLAKAFDAQDGEIKAEFEKLRNMAGEHQARLNEIEQKGARTGGDVDIERNQSLGQEFIKQGGLVDFAERGGRNDNFAFECKATLTSSTANAAGAVGAAQDVYRDPALVPLPQRRRVVRSLLPVIPIEAGSVEFIRQVGRNNNASVVAEGAAKPGSDMQLEKVVLVPRVIAHWIKASRQVLGDVPQLAGLIDTELEDGLDLAEEAQLLNGDGTGENLTGLIPAATAFSAPFAVSSPTMIDTIGLALLQSALAEYPATGIIMHPADWTRLTLLKNSDGDYILGSPGSAIPQRLWGIPVVTTKAVSIDKFLLGDFQRAATIYDRWTTRVEAGYVNDDFTKNLVTILAEKRLAQAIKKGAALTYGDFGLVS